jgi:hypothetical protein
LVQRFRRNPNSLRVSGPPGANAHYGFQSGQSFDRRRMLLHTSGLPSAAAVNGLNQSADSIATGSCSTFADDWLPMWSRFNQANSSIATATCSASADRQALMTSMG